MNEKFQRVKELTKITGELTDAVKKINAIAQKINDKDDKSLQQILSTLIVGYSKLNFMFSVYLMNIAPKSLRSDKIKAKFEKLIKPLEKDMKKRRKK